MTRKESSNIFLLEPAKFSFMAMQDDFYLIFSSKKVVYQKLILLGFISKN